jgi:hypothetical protein
MRPLRCVSRYFVLTFWRKAGPVALLKLMRIPVVISVAVVVIAGVLGGPSTAALVAILAVMEITLSFDNAVVNATVLRRMSAAWQRVFLTVGVLVAVFGMRLVFPIVVVTLTTHKGPSSVLNLALHHPHAYATALDAAHPAIAAFGGVFLLMIFLDYMAEAHEPNWIGPIERALAHIGELEQATAVIGLVALLAVAEASAHTDQILVSGVAGLAAYLAVNALSGLAEAGDDDGEVDGAEGDVVEEPGIHGGDDVALAVKVPGRLMAGGGIFLFLYLEILDASFSFDGVTAAFAITSQIFVIAAGLGIGALFIRTLTVYLVRAGTLEEYPYLDNGAHFAIGSLAVILGITIFVSVPDLVTGLIGILCIAGALASSVVHNRREAAGAELAPSSPVAT